MFLATKLADPTVSFSTLQATPNRVAASDVYDSHNYEQDPQLFAAVMAPLAELHPFTNGSDMGETGLPVPYAGQPYWCPEFGGIWGDPDAPASPTPPTFDAGSKV